MPAKSTKLDRLLEQEASLKDAIKAARKIEKQQQAETYAKRCEIIGAAILGEMEAGKNAALADMVEPIIEKRTTKARDRKMLGLAPKKKT